MDVIVFSQGVVVPQIASQFAHWELRQARRLQIARHSADNKDYTDYTGLQGAAVLLLLLLHRMTESIYLQSKFVESLPCCGKRIV